MTAPPPQPSIALFEPHAPAAHRMAAALCMAGYRVEILPDPLLSGRAWFGRHFDMIVATPGTSGFRLAATLSLLRAIARNRPVLVIDQDNSPLWRVFALESGADDAMVLGDEHDELFARIAALLRRYQRADGQLSCDDLTIDLVRREVSRAGRNVAMPLREFDLLSRLARSADQPVSRTDLFRAVWRMDIDPGTNRIDVHMSRLRQRVDAGHARPMLRTVKGFGYALVSERGEPVFERQLMLHHA